MVEQLVCDAAGNNNALYFIIARVDIFKFEMDPDSGTKRNHNLDVLYFSELSKDQSLN